MVVPAGEKEVVVVADHRRAAVFGIVDRHFRRLGTGSLYLYTVLIAGFGTGNMQLLNRLKFNTGRLANLMLLISALILFFSIGGLAVTLLEARASVARTEALLPGIVTGAAICSVWICWRVMLRRHQGEAGPDGSALRKKVFFNLILVSLLVAVTLVMMNIAASFFTVTWPMSGLHGVSSTIGKQAWEYQSKAEGDVHVNSWGQRDVEHSVAPQAGVYRMVFVGDSFLEQGANVPLVARTAALLQGADPSYELINLGVSATEPDEYFYRLKRIGLSLQPNHCVMTFYAGNDFIHDRTLLSYGGVSATYPRLSFLQVLGLRSLDQIISNERRPILRAWFKGGALLKHELELQEIFGKTGNDRETEGEYLSFFPTESQNRLKSVLNSSSAEARNLFFTMLRHPDGGRFRSYFLDVATKAANGMPAPEYIDDSYAYGWVKASQELCRRNGVKFTLVVIPEGFSVDSRMAAHYAALADMRAYLKYLDDATGRFVNHARTDGMDVIDLRELLTNVPGAYLNMDGHWTQQGVDRIARYLADRFAHAKDDRQGK